MPEARVALLSVPAGCDVTADLEHSCAKVSQSYVKVKADDDSARAALRAEITLRDGTPSTTYDVWVNPAESAKGAVVCAEPDPGSTPSPVAEVEDHPHLKGPLTTDNQGRGKLRLTVDSADSRFISICVVPRLEAETPSTVSALRKELGHFEAMVIAP